MRCIYSVICGFFVRLIVTISFSESRKGISPIIVYKFKRNSPIPVIVHWAHILSVPAAKIRRCVGNTKWKHIFLWFEYFYEEAVYENKQAVHENKQAVYEILWYHFCLFPIFRRRSESRKTCVFLLFSPFAERKIERKFEKKCEKNCEESGKCLSLQRFCEKILLTIYN